MTREPDFDDLVGGNLSEAERRRLRAVHDQLLQAGPPPELPQSLEPVPAADDENTFPLFPRRRWAAALALAAALAAAAFGAGYLVGDRESTREPERVVAMTGAGSAAGARASLSVYDEDGAGNWPMRLTVQELPPLGDGRTYELWLTKRGELAAQCGSFATEEGTTEVPLNAPFPLGDYDGWVVVESGKTDVLLRTSTI
jgi:hypothetical protein